MADNLQIRSDAVAVLGTVRADDVGGIHYPTSKISLGTDNVDDGFVSAANPLPVRADAAQDAKITYGVQATVAPGSSADLDSTQISAGKTGRLQGLVIAATVPFKAVLVTVLNGVPSTTTKAVFISEPGTVYFRPPSRDHFKVTQDAAAGLDGFRVSLTNLTTGANAADLHVCFMWDED